MSSTALAASWFHPAGPFPSKSGLICFVIASDHFLKRRTVVTRRVIAEVARAKVDEPFPRARIRTARTR